MDTGCTQRACCGDQRDTLEGRRIDADRCRRRRTPEGLLWSLRGPTDTEALPRLVSRDRRSLAIAAVFQLMDMELGCPSMGTGH